MSPAEVRNNNTTGSASSLAVDMKLEVVVIPVSDIDRAKEFYARLAGGSTPTAPSAITSVWPSSRLPVPAPPSNSAPA
jgi:hypothetical protein